MGFSSSSRMTIVTSGNDDVIEQIIKQLDKLIDVINVTDITSEDHLEREIVLISLKSKDFNKSKLKENDNIKHINFYLPFAKRYVKEPIIGKKYIIDLFKKYGF